MELLKAKETIRLLYTRGVTIKKEKILSSLDIRNHFSSEISSLKWNGTGKGIGQ
jgi:hypothetical protein